MDQWKSLLDNLNLKVNITLVCQDNAEGIPHALKLCEEIINYKDHYLALGDNILIGSNMMKNFRSICLEQKRGSNNGYPVKNVMNLVLQNLILMVIFIELLKSQNNQIQI